MSIVKHRHYRPALWNSFFDDFLTRDFVATPERRVGARYSVPAANAHELKDAFEVEIAAPGLQKGDFRIELNDKVPKISAERKEEQKEEKENYARVEFSYTNFSRSFVLPETVDSAKISAKYENGILRLHLPKHAHAVVEKNREIEVG